MPIPKEIIDNSEENRLVSFLNNTLKENPKTKLDIATAFFNIEAFAMIKDNLNGVERFRLLLGKTPEIQNEKTLGDFLLQEIRKEIEDFDLTKEANKTVKLFIEFLKRKHVEIRLFEKFLHGKAYIFDDRIVIGSSNFTAAGLTRYGELNTWMQESHVVYTRKEWFEKFWAESIDFKEELIRLLEESRFGTIEYMPFQIYIKSLFELQREEIMAEKDADDKKREVSTVSNVELTEFQQDAVLRVFSRLKKYGAVIVADSVGLGKTFIALKVLEEFGYYRRKRCLVICPAQLKETMWLPELKDKLLSENILSQENLATEDFIEKAKKATGGHLEEIELIIVDESHNLRNPYSNRWENLHSLIETIAKGKGKKPKIMFMTATPINNTIWDIYWQIMLLVGLDKAAFIKENIPDLFTHFKDIDRKGDPTLLNDLLNEISIRRTRDYIKKEYADATISGKKITFPDRKLETIYYKLDKAYQGMYKEIADTISEKLTMAYYKILKYKKNELQSQEEILLLNRMIAIGGIFNTILLKRLESSVDSFRISIKRHIDFLKSMMTYLEKGKLISKQAYKKFLKYILASDDELEEDPEEIEQSILSQLDNFKLEQYKKDELFNDIKTDIKLLNAILEKVNKITPEQDAKLIELKERLAKMHTKGQVVVFTYYKDTLEYVHKFLTNQKEFKNASIVKISGSSTGSEREKILTDFKQKKINILISTDVLSEGQNLQTAQFLINYDLHWNPTRMIQRAGRIDRIGSPFNTIHIYNFFPEDELEDLLRLVNILQNKIINIDKSVGLDQSVLGEIIHPKVFGIIRRIRDNENSVLDELEADVFGGGEIFYQPLRAYIKKRSIQELEELPDGIHSGIDKKKIKGIFFYYKYGNDFHFWYLHDLDSGNNIKNKTEILKFILCNEKTPRVIPDFFDEVYATNRKIIKDIEDTYKSIESSVKTDTQLVPLGKDKSAKFVISIVKEIHTEIESYLLDFPEDNSLEKEWDATKERLLGISLTKKRLQDIRKIWKAYRSSPNWKNLIRKLTEFVSDKLVHEKEPIEPFDSKKLRLITLEFVS